MLVSGSDLGHGWQGGEESCGDEAVNFMVLADLMILEYNWNMGDL